ncbi:hypothetical protein R6Q57_014714 [Mikania cordata]
MTGEPATEAPVNGGRNYNGPKVAKFLVGLKKPPTNALRPIIPDNACILCITATAGIELADAYSPDTIIASSLGKEVHDPWAFYLHAALLHQAFAHCRKFPTAASRRSLGLRPIETVYLRLSLGPYVLTQG